ncbi:MAG TPA: diguanylate cyclase [Candidatus Bathyarchaeia archaeon]|nr:diguanylate cyclase [Candidatus Bathyarchaeia archaeon]
MPRLPSRSTRVLGAIALLAVSSIVLAGGVFAVTERDQSQLDFGASQVDKLHAIALVMNGDVDEQEAALDDFVLTGDQAALDRYEAASQRDADALQALRAQSYDQPLIESAMAGVASANAAWRTSVAEPAILAKQTNNKTELDRFIVIAPNDHTAVEVAASHVDSLLDDAEANLALRSSAVGNARLAGTAIGFAVFLLSFGLALVVVRRFGRTVERDAQQAGVLNRFTEVTSFAGEDREVAIASLTALSRLVHPDGSVTHVLNRSLDRAIPEAKTGDAIADVLPMHELSRCAGMVRGTIYVSDDLSDDLAVHCPIYSAASGTLACIPLRSGESVGAVHLYWARPRALPLELRAAVARITEHAALAIGNRRMLAALHGQANTDPRTGLANSRAFDVAFEEMLAGRSDSEVMSVLMIDIDQFKLFNDRHGHPSGDEALRSFAGVLQSSMRDGDVAARYGGEEFAVLLPGVDQAAALMIAERIRARTESTIISLAPGLTDRITVSIGIATAPDQGTERVGLLRLADEALYQAKADGRNRVATIGDAAA